MKKSKTKNISKKGSIKKGNKKTLSEKPKKETKKLTVKQKERIKVKADKQKLEIKVQKKITSNKEKGKFNGQLTNLLLKGFTIKNPDISKKKFSESLGISVTTLNNAIKGKKLNLKTLKKISTNMNSFLDSKKQLELTLIAEHLKKYKTISKKKLDAIKEKIKKSSKYIEQLPNKEFLFFKIHYSQNKLKTILEGLK